MRTAILSLYCAGVVFLNLSFAGILFAQKPAEAKTPPKVSTELAHKLWRAQSEANAAELALEHSKESAEARQAEYRRQQVMQEWQAFCGAEFITGTDANGEPACVEKPKAPPAPNGAPEPSPANSKTTPKK